MAVKDRRKDRKRRYLKDRVYSGIKNAIITGELEPRARLVEETLAELMKASRTPVRETLQKLEEEDLVYRRPRRLFYASYCDRRHALERIGHVFR